MRQGKFRQKEPMGTAKRLAEEVERGLAGALPELRKTAVRKLTLAVGA